MLRLKNIPVLHLKHRKKNIELQAQLQKLQEQLANEAAERDRIIEENRRQILEEEKKARDALKQQMMEELRQEVR